MGPSRRTGRARWSRSAADVVLVTEGTYPHAHGGVSVWCDQLVTGLPELTFRIVALTAFGYQRPVYDLPPHADRLTTVGLWDSRHLGRRGRAGSTPPATGPRSSRAAQLAALLARPDDDVAGFRRFLDGLAPLGPDEIARQFCFRELLAALDTELRATRWTPISGARASDLVQAAEILDHLLRPVAVEVDPAPVYHASSNGLAALVCMLAQRRHGGRFLLTEHGIYLRERYIELRRSTMARPAKALLLRFHRLVTAAAYAEATVIAPGSDWNQRWESRHGAPEHRLRTIYNGIDPTEFPSRPDEPQSPVVSWLGRVDPIKDLETLIRAFDVVHGRHPDARLRLYGRTPPANEDYRSSLEQLVSSLGLDEVVSFEGGVARSADAYRDAQIGVLSSISEGFPYSLIEAMACGLPTVATGVGGVPEAVGDTGIVVAPRAPGLLGAAIADLLDDEARRRRLGPMARERVLGRFTLDACLEGYRQLYAELRSCVLAPEVGVTTPTSGARTGAAAGPGPAGRPVVGSPAGAGSDPAGTAVDRGPVSPVRTAVSSGNGEVAGLGPAGRSVAGSPAAAGGSDPADVTVDLGPASPVGTAVSSVNGQASDTTRPVRLIEPVAVGAGPASGDGDDEGPPSSGNGEVAGLGPAGRSVVGSPAAAGGSDPAGTAVDRGPASPFRAAVSSGNGQASDTTRPARLIEPVVVGARPGLSDGEGLTRSASSVEPVVVGARPGLSDGEGLTRSAPSVESVAVAAGARPGLDDAEVQALLAAAGGAAAVADAVDVDEVAATFESVGLTDQVAVERFGSADVFDLAERARDEAAVRREPGTPRHRRRERPKVPLPSARGALGRGLTYVLPALVVAAASLGSVPQGALVAASSIGWGLAQGGGVLGFTALHRTGATTLAPLRRALVAVVAVIVVGGVGLGAATSTSVGLAFTLPLLHLAGAASLVLARRTRLVLALVAPVSLLSSAALVWPGSWAVRLVAPVSAGTVAATLTLVALVARGPRPAERTLERVDWIRSLPLVGCGWVTAAFALLAVSATSDVRGLDNVDSRQWLLLGLPLWVMVAGSEWLLLRVRRSLSALLEASPSIPVFRRAARWSIVRWIELAVLALQASVWVATAASDLAPDAAWRASSVFFLVAVALVGVTVLTVVSRVGLATAVLGVAAVALAGLATTHRNPYGIADHSAALAICGVVALALGLAAVRGLADPASQR